MASAMILPGWERLLKEALDEVHEVLLSLDRSIAKVGIARFAALLNSCRQAAGVEAWKDLIERVVRTHPSFHLFQQDPFTRRSFVKPRGYAGDPCLLDFIFEHPSSLPERHAASEVGQFIAGFSTHGAAAQAVRERRGILARAIDDTSQRISSPKILSLACGYLREAEVSSAFCDQKLGRLVAMDHDLHTTERLRGSHCSFALDVRIGSPRDLLTRSYREQLGTNFDLVYAAGLYDYLSDRFARRLLAEMFDLLAPGGRVIVANFAPHLPDAGYMEACMDWWLVHRTHAQMYSLADAIDPSRIANTHTFCDTTEHIIFLELTKS